MFGVKDPYKDKDPYADLRADAAMQSSPVPTTGSPTADFMQQGGADLSQYGGAPSMPANDQFSPAPQQTTADFMSEKADGFDVKGLLSDFGKAFGDSGVAEQKMPAMPALQVSPLQYGAGAKPVVQALPDLNTQQQQKSAAAQAIANAASMYAGQPQQQQPVQQQQQPTLINRMLFG
jgi:hypothetical protein